MTLQPIHSDAGASFAYYGEREGWLVALSVHRDSDTVERSNWRVIVPDMLERFTEDAAVERMNHWAVGWVDYLLVRPGSLAATVAQRTADKLADYPLWSEEDYGELEWSEEWCVRCDRGTREQHDGTGWDRFRSAEDADDIRGRWDIRTEYRDGRAYGRAYRDSASPYVGASLAWERGYRDGMASDTTTAPAWLAHWRGL